MEFVDKPYTDNVRLMSPENAYMAGRIKTSKLEDLRYFERAFPLDPAKVVTLFKEMREISITRPEGLTAKEKVDFTFLKLLPMCYAPSQAPDWEAVLDFEVKEIGEYTIRVANDQVEVVPGLSDDPEATSVSMDYETYRAVLRFVALEDSQLLSQEQLDSWQSAEEAMDVELSDDQLEAVAGGKSCGNHHDKGKPKDKDKKSCGSQAGKGQACGSDACGAAAGAGGACGGARCGVAACAGDACGANACGADACAGAACGVAGGSGACAGNACGVDLSSGVDCGPCGVNVIPVVPGI
ncbi:MAG: hypothetical protein HQL56_14150 [Magnetococcales bacterium]|nr:hypothetical protein [Magnetococcales bacterium]